MMVNKNIVYADVLKILASIAVVMIHVCAMEWYNQDPLNIKWNVLNIYSSLSRWAVPIFVMVTGIFLLSPAKEITIKEVFTKYIKRIIVVLVFWVIIYALLEQINLQEGFSKKVFIENIIDSHYHLWYLYMLIGLYLITPLIKVIINNSDEKLIKYYLVLWFVIQCILFTVINLPTFSKYKIIYENITVGFVLGYIGYYILGYYLDLKNINKIQRIITYIIGGTSLFITIFLARWLNIKYNVDICHIAYSPFSPFVVAMSVAVFVFIKLVFNNVKVSDKITLIIKNITNLSFGVYLIHPMFIIFMDKFNFDILAGNSFFVIPLIVIIVYILSMLTTYIISKSKYFI